MTKFYEVTAQLEQALSAISYENLDISDEVKEQVEIHHLIIVLSLFRAIQNEEPDETSFPL